MLGATISTFLLLVYFWYRFDTRFDSMSIGGFWISICNFFDNLNYMEEANLSMKTPPEYSQHLYIKKVLLKP